MRAKIYRFISKHGSILCALAILVAPIACEQCRVLFYEPVEPKGLDMFIKEHKNNFKEDVSAGKTRTMTGSSSGTASAEKSFTVYEEDYMKSLVTKHSAVIGAYKWGPSNETTTKATC